MLRGGGLLRAAARLVADGGRLGALPTHPLPPSPISNAVVARALLIPGPSASHKLRIGLRSELSSRRDRAGALPGRRDYFLADYVLLAGVRRRNGYGATTYLLLAKCQRWCDRLLLASQQPHSRSRLLVFVF
jgi:hypothetical protein